MLSLACLTGGWSEVFSEGPEVLLGNQTSWTPHRHLTSGGTAILVFLPDFESHTNSTILKTNFKNKNID